MEYTMQLVRIPGTHVSGIHVSLKRRECEGWLALDAFPAVNGTGVSARGRPV
jgi:hypothetical protein